MARRKAREVLRIELVVEVELVDKAIEEDELVGVAIAQGPAVGELRVGVLASASLKQLSKAALLWHGGANRRMGGTLPLQPTEKNK